MSGLAFPAEEPGVLVVVAGQSNALGFGVKPAELPAGSARPDPYTFILTNGHFDVMEPGVNTGTSANPTAWGPEVQYARDFRATHPGELLFIVKVVKGSTGLAADPDHADWSPHSRGELFDEAAAAIAKAKAIVHLPVHSVLWMQGEEDATDAAKAGAYLGNEADLFAHIRTAWGDDATKIIVGRIGAETGLPFADQVREAQDSADVLDPAAKTISTDGLPLQDDHLHLNGAGELALGDAFYQADEPPAPPYVSLFGRGFGHGSLFGHWVL